MTIPTFDFNTLPDTENAEEIAHKRIESACNHYQLHPLLRQWAFTILAGYQEQGQSAQRAFTHALAAVKAWRAQPQEQ